MKKLLVSLLLFAASVANAACDQFVAWGFPTLKQETIPLCQIAYYTAWNPATKNPAYSAEYLLEENVSGKEPRRGEFKPHPNTPAEKQASNADYAKSGFDRGHLAAAANMRKDSAMMMQSFYLTNMVPQYPELNRQLWAWLEKAVREKVTPERPLYVVTGPLYQINPPQTIGSGIWVPSHTFKVIYDLRSNTVASYVMPNMKTLGGNVESYYVPFSHLQSLIDIVIFPKMSADVKLFLREKPLKDW